jgi:hypothetical protein
MTGTKLSFIISYTIYTPDLSVAEHYGLRNTTCLYSKDVASGHTLCVKMKNVFVCTVYEKNIFRFSWESVRFMLAP